METNLSDLLAAQPAWQLILRAYAAAEAVVAEHLAADRAAAKKAAKAAARAAGKPIAAPDAATVPMAVESSASPDSQTDDAGGDDNPRNQTWVQRLREVAGVPTDQLAPIHGRLIAEGLLQFNLGGREEGVLYRLTRDAKQVLSGLAEPAVDATADAAVDGDLAVAAARAA